MSSAKGDLLFVAPVAAVFCAALVLLLSSSSVQASGTGREMIGTITYKNHFVERKASSQVMWNALAQSSPVFNGDTIHTTAGSSAVLHLDKQADVSLGEETLVRIDVAQKKADILLDGGMITVRKESPGSELGISTAAAKVSLREGALSVQGKGDRLLVSVVEGGASLDAGKGTQDLPAGASLELQSGRALRPFAQLVAPAVGSAIYRDSEDAPTQFRWSPNPARADRTTQAWRLIVASDGQFKRVEASCDSKRSDATLTLPDGTHYWKIAADSSGDAADAGESAVGWFHLLHQESPLPIEPRDGSIIACGEKPPLVSFSWGAVDNASGYRLTVRDAGTGATVLSRLVDGRSIALDGLAKGVYRWQASALCAPGAREFAGPGFAFTIEPRALAAPQVRSRSAAAANGAALTITATALRRGASIASWDEVTGVDYYEARIAGKREGTAPLAQARTAVNSIASPVPLAPGDYFLQVRSVSGSAASDYSTPIAFTVTGPQPIVALAPAEGFTADPETRRVRFAWDDPNDSGSVKLQLSAEPSFQRPIVELLASGAAAEVGIPGSASGRIYWRVAALSDELGRNSSVLSFRMPDRLEAPRIIGPAEGVAVDIGSTDRLRLAWEPSPGANRYLVGLYQLIGSKRSLVRSWDGPELYADLPRLRDVGVGQFSWSLRALSISGGETVSRSPEDLAYFALSHTHPLPPPVVHRPANGAKP